MKILHFIVSRHFAGSEQLALTLALQQQAWGHETWMAGRGGGELSGIVAQSGLRNAQVKISRFWPQWNLRRFVREVGVDIVHLHLTGAVKLAPFFCQLGVPTVAHLHIHKDHPAYHKAVQSGHLISISQATHRYYLEAGLPAERVHLIPNGSGAHLGPWRQQPKEALQVELRQELGLPLVGPLWLHAGRLSAAKGQDLSIEALAKLASRWPDTRLLIAGATNAYQQELEALAQRWKVSDQVRFLGFRPDIQRLMRAADLLLVPSRQEPFGLVVIEGMLLGTPVVTTGVGGIADILREPGMASVVCSGDAEDMADTIAALQADCARRQTIATQAEKVALEYFSSEAMTRQVMQVYEQTLLEHHASKP
ncbi:MAG: glycosyltransferase family 4 protein [Verrucomicrobiota bacterium JB022]|nr:glycosyltransferase family 4 protein [Verrucomicrobiota bacterium JB022]